MTDDDLDRDDEILDDEDEEDDDEQLGRFQNRRPPVKPFSAPGAGSSFGSSTRPPGGVGGSSSGTRDTSQLPGSRPGSGFQSRYGSSSSTSSTSPFTTSGGASRPGSSPTPSASRPAFTPPGGVIGGRRDDDKPEEKREDRPAASSASSSSPARPGVSAFRSSPTSGGDRPSEQRDHKPAASTPPKSGGSGGGPLSSVTQGFGGLRDKLPGGDEKKDNKPAPSRSGGGGGSPLSSISQGLGGLRDKLPGGGNKKDNKPAPSRSGGGGGSPLSSISQGLGGLRSKLPGGGDKKDNKPAASSGSSSGAARSPFSSGGGSPGGTPLGSRAASSSAASAPAAKKDAKAGASGGLFSRLPFLNRAQESKPRTTTTREKIERASKAPRVDERGLTLDNKLDILGVGLLLGSLALFFSSMSSTKGQLTEAINTFISQLLGVGAIAVPVVMFVIGVWLIIRHFGDEAPVIDPVRLSGVGLIYFGGLLLFQFIESFNPEYAGINLRNFEELRLQLELSYMLGRGGGWLGAEVYYLLVTNIGEAGMVISMFGLLLIGAMLTLRISAAEVAIFFISMWRSFSDAQRRRAETREARARLRAAELAAAAESRVSISKPAAAELPGGASPALPAAASVDATGEPRPIPITMGGRTVTAFFDGQEAVPVSADAEAAAAEKHQPSVAARLFSAVPVLGRSSENKPARPTNGTKTAGVLGGLFNRTSSDKPQLESGTKPAQPAASPAEQTAAPVQPAAAQPAPAVAAPPQSVPPVTVPAPAASTTAQPEVTAQPEPARIGDLLRSVERPSPFARPGTPAASPVSRPASAVSSAVTRPPEPDMDEEDEDEELSTQTPSRPAGSAPAPGSRGSLWARPTAHPAGSPSLDERRERLNAIRSGQTAHPMSPGAAPVPTQTPDTPQRQPIVFRETTEDQNGTSARPAAAISTPAAPAPSPAFARPAGPPASPPPRKRRDWKLPDYRALLSTGSETDFDREVLLKQARTIEETLQSFGAPGRVVEVNTGPVITQFGVEPDYLVSRSGKKSRVKVGAIAQLDKDLQLALGAKSIRIEAPVPGKGYVGIEVPNEEPSIVSLRDVMESEQFQKIRNKSPLVIALGQSVDGTPVSADLGVMPHLLIAGTTGSGKSVLVNAIISSLLINNPPDIVKFIMVDPKRVELTGYNGIPHLVAPVVVDLERTVGVLKWVTREMDERYKQFSNAGARNIEDFNKHLPADRERMPYIVVIIDELADLMMLAPDETERVITRIAALARATGIHLVIATQRPSVDVVTGLIKANFPARIAFAVAGGVDSRVILDQPGAERLLGRGDMLYLSGNSPAPLRLQGVWVSEQEISNITRYWKQQNADQPEPHIIKALVVDDAPEEAREVQPATTNRFAQQAAFWDDTDEDDEDMDLHDRVKDERDDLYEQAVDMVRRLNKASVSLLQRRLRIGYTRAARLIDMMEAEGIVGPAQEGSKPRDVLPPKA